MDMTKSSGKLSRRDFLKGALVSGSLLALGGITATGQPTFEQLAKKINWQEDLVERMAAPVWQPPEGWEFVKEKVDSITAFNSGAMEYDPATAKNFKIFEDVTGIKVNLIVVPDGALQQRELTMFMGRSDEADVVYVKPQGAFDIYRSNWVDPIDFMWNDEAAQLYSPAGNTACRWKGQWYGTSWMGKSGELVFRKDLLDKYVGTTKPPTTWQELIDYAKQLTVDTDGDGNVDIWGLGFYTGANYPRGFMMNLHKLLFSEGIRPDDVLDERGIPHYNIPEGVLALEFMQKAVQEYKISPIGVTTSSDSDIFEMFRAGKLAMMFNNTWVNFKLDEIWPREKWGISLIPNSGGWNDTPEGTPATRIGPYAYSVNTFTDPWKKVAAALLIDMTRSFQAYKNQQVVEQNQALMPSVYEDPEVKEVVPYFREITDILENGYEILYPNGFAVVDVLRENANKAIYGKISAQEAMDSAQKEFEEFFPKG